MTQDVEKYFKKTQWSGVRSQEIVFKTPKHPRLQVQKYRFMGDVIGDW